MNARTVENEKIRVSLIQPAWDDYLNKAQLIFDESQSSPPKPPPFTLSQIQRELILSEAHAKLDAELELRKYKEALEGEAHRFLFIRYIREYTSYELDSFMPGYDEGRLMSEAATAAVGMAEAYAKGNLRPHDNDEVAAEFMKTRLNIASTEIARVREDERINLLRGEDELREYALREAARIVSPPSVGLDELERHCDQSGWSIKVYSSVETV